MKYLFIQDKINNNDPILKSYEIFPNELIESHDNNTKETYIKRRSSLIINEKIRILDNQLYEHFQKIDLDCSFFLQRWLRCIFNREFDYKEVLILWDSIFSYEYTNKNTQKYNLIYIEFISIAMIIRIRDDLKYSDQNECFSTLFKYPKINNIKDLIKLSDKVAEVINERINGQNSNVYDILGIMKPIESRPFKITPHEYNQRKGSIDNKKSENNNTEFSKNAKTLLSNALTSLGKFGGIVKDISIKVSEKIDKINENYFNEPSNNTNINGVKILETNNNNKNNNNNNKNEIKNLNSNLLEKLNTSLNISPSNENFSFKIENNTNSSFSDTIIINNINNNINNNSTEKKILKKIKCMDEFTKTGFAGEDEKKINQDNFFVFHNFLNSSTYIFMAILDGHGEVGQEISGYIKENLPLNLNKTLKESNINIENNNINEIINEVFIEENYLLVTNDKINSMLSGSTCAGLIYTPSKLISINVGDSRIILGKNINNKFINYDLTTDHKPSLIEESKRILNRGGEIYPMKDTEGNFIGPERVWIKNEEYPGLAMSRSFGDRIAHSVGVIVEPEIREYFFKEEDMFIVLGSDGLFEFISSQEVVDIVKKYYIENDIVSCCEELYKISCERWMKEEEVIDDITIIVIFLE
jgi:serine/threonine protein phosphatase PrpC